MAVISLSNIDSYHEGRPTTGPIDVTGNLDKKHEGKPVVGKRLVNVKVIQTVTIAEDISVSVEAASVSDITLNASDSITITDVVTVDNSTVPLETSDAISVSEDISIAIQQFGTVVWGHDTGVEEEVVRNFQGNWTGTGSIGGADNEEVLEIETGKYMESENIQLGTGNVVIALNKYRSGTFFPVRKYKTAATEEDLAGLGWSSYTDQFYCEGWAKIRLEAA